MRKINFLFGVLAVAATGLLSSCDWSDNDEDPNVIVPSLGGNTLVVNANVNASFKVEGQTPQNGTTATFAVSGDKAIVEVSAAGYLTQNVEVNFGENTMMNVDVQLVKASTNAKTQEEAKNGTLVENDEANQDATDIEASISVPANVEISNVEATALFSVVAFTPAAVGAQNVNQGAEVSVPALSLNCEPSGAKFDGAPVTLTATAADAAGCLVACVNGGESVNATVNGNSVSAKVTHFSVWSFVLKATVENVQPGEDVIKKGSVLLSNGKSTISYTQKFGFEASDVQNGGLISNFLVNQFGKAGSINKSVEISADKAGSADYTVKQNVKTYTFKSGDRRFIAKVYGKVTVTIDRKTTDTSGHSGGTGK